MTVSSSVNFAENDKNNVSNRNQYDDVSVRERIATSVLHG